MSRRKFFLALTVKNEAPNIWEWVAYHRAIGFTDIAIYQNDSVDGTQTLLSTMAQAGFIQYFPNSCRFKAWQNKAYRRASRLAEYKTADWAMALDADEFLVVRTGAGKLCDLVDALPLQANACTIHWKAFGSSYHADMPHGLVTEAFTMAEEHNRIQRRKAGFKTIFKPSGFRRLGIHKPKEAYPDVQTVYCNGSGKLHPNGIQSSWRSKDADSRALAQVNHYAIRDLERFIVKSARGRTSNTQRLVDRVYWNDFEFNDAVDDLALKQVPETKAEMQRMDEQTNGQLSKLTKAGRAATHAVFNDLMKDPYYRDIFDDIAAGFPSLAKAS
jgi:hypothetical protein